MIGDAGRRRLRTHEFAPVDIDFFVQLGAPESAFNDNGIMDVDQLIDQGWEIDDEADAFNPPANPTPNSLRPEPDS